MIADDAEKVLQMMKKWYNNDRKALEWYVKPWIWTDKQHWSGIYYSPMEMVEAGEGERIVQMLKMLSEGRI